MSLEALAHFAIKAENKVRLGQAKLVLWYDIKDDPPRQLKISPIAAIPHKSKAYRSILYLSFWLQWALTKKTLAYKFNSYVVGTEHETKNLQPELTLLNSLSRTQHGKIFDKKTETMASKPIVAKRSFLETPPT